MCKKTSCRWFSTGGVSVGKKKRAEMAKLIVDMSDDCKELIVKEAKRRKITLKRLVLEAFEDQGIKLDG